MVAQCRPPRGAKLHWHDKVRQDLTAFHIDEAGWYFLPQDRQKWCKVYDSSSGSTINVAPNSRLYCDGCRHSFSQP